VGGGAGVFFFFYVCFFFCCFQVFWSFFLKHTYLRSSFPQNQFNLNFSPSLSSLLSFTFGCVMGVGGSGAVLGLVLCVWGEAWKKTLFLSLNQPHKHHTNTLSPFLSPLLLFPPFSPNDLQE